MIQALAPFSFQPPSTCSAVISSPPKSLPTPGSLKPAQPISSPVEHARQQARDMRGLAVAGEAGAGVVMVDQREGEGEVGLGDLLEGAQLAGEGQPLPAMLLRQLDGVEAGRAGGLDGLERIAPLPFPARGVGRDMVGGKGLGLGDDGELFGRQGFVQHAPRDTRLDLGGASGRARMAPARV